MGRHENKRNISKSEVRQFSSAKRKKRALIAVGHKILIAAYFILKDKVEYQELGYEYLQSLKKDKKIDRHIKILKELGIEVEIKNRVV